MLGGLWSRGIGAVKLSELDATEVLSAIQITSGSAMLGGLWSRGIGTVKLSELDATEVLSAIQITSGSVMVIERQGCYKYS